MEEKEMDDAVVHEHSEEGRVVLPPGVEPLSEEERSVLEYEQSWWRYARTKADAIRCLGMSSAHYYVVLGKALDKPAALFEYPELVRRLLRLRERRAAERHGRADDGYAIS